MIALSLISIAPRQMCDSSRSSSSSPNRPQSWSAMQRILHSYLESACHAFQARERWIVSGVRELQSHLCTQEHDSSHSFQWSPTFTQTHTSKRLVIHISLAILCYWWKGSVVWGKRHRETLWISASSVCIFARSFQMLLLGDAFTSTAHTQGFSCA